MLTTPTPALYMENFSDAAKGKVKAAEREAEKKKKEGGQEERKEDEKRKAVLQQRLQQRTGLAGPAMPRPSALCALAGARLRAVAEGRPAWELATARVRAAVERLRAVAEGHQGHGAAGMPRPHAGRRAFWRTAMGATLSARVKMVAWPRAGLARRARLNMVLGFQHGAQQRQ